MLRRLVTGGLFRGVPFDQLFLHPFKGGIRGTFNGMVENEGQSRDKREAGNGRTPQFQSRVLHVFEQWLGVFDSGVNRERGEGPDWR